MASSRYDPKKIEPKFQKIWEKELIHKTENNSKKNKYYSLVEFPYPSGEGLHVGHIRSYTAMDIVSRKKRMEGYNVLYPIGWDAFGLPAENFAIKTGIHPSISIKKNTDNFRKQMKAMGLSFDWSREVNTSDPKYYKWTQWIFLQFFKKGLAYKAEIPINWCPKDKIGLANEEVIDGKCERCGTLVEKKNKKQWMLAITKYAKRLYDDLDLVQYIEKVKAQQRNWIGPSEGAEIEFGISNLREKIRVFTTRPDTLFGATYVVLAPEHPIVNELVSKAENKREIDNYAKIAKKKTEIERFAENREKTGIEIQGVKAINPANKKKIPIWIADYVVSGYGTGAIMAVPAHDERDWNFAKKFNLPINEVIIPKVIDKHDPPVSGKKTIFRHAIQAIVVNPKNKKVLCLKWKKFPWTTFVTGGVEKGEDMILAAKREVEEETGYKNLKFIRALGGPVESHFFANHKNENRKAVFTALVFEITSDKHDQISKKESEIHEVSWMTWSEIAKDKNIKCAEYDIWFDRFFNSPHAFTGEGVLINSGRFSNTKSEEVKKEITKFVGGKWVTRFKLRDWVFSRQRYWGEPIPIIHCEKCGIVPVPEKSLPVKLPNVERYRPTDTGESPLANIRSWVNVKCPKCKGLGKRETDVMPNWAGSSWYFYRYCDFKNRNKFADLKVLKKWMPIDWYNGGMEHTVLHLLYSRFWHKFLYDLKLVPNKEPYGKRTSHGIVLGPDGEKMSKSKGNIINPDEVIKLYGADTLRLYEMFIGPFDQTVAWSREGIVGPRRFLEKVWKIGKRIDGASSKNEADENDAVIHKTIKKVGEDIESMSFNTAVSALMVCANELDKAKFVKKYEFELFLKILAPFAPFIADEVWRNLGHRSSIHLEAWPQHKDKVFKKENFQIVIQINGKIRGQIEIPASIKEEELIKMAISLPEVGKWLENKLIKKSYYIKGRLLSLVTQ